MIGDMIKQLRISQSYTQTVLGQKLNLSASTIGMYEQNRRLPDTNTLIALHDLFSVSVDYILEITDSPKQYPKSLLSVSISERISILISDVGISIDTLAEMSNIRKNRLEAFIDKSIHPDATELKTLSECLDESTDYLLGLTDEHNIIQRQYNANSEEFSEILSNGIADAEWLYTLSDDNRLGRILTDYCQRVEKSEDEFAKELDISTETYICLTIGKFSPSMQLIKKISDITQYTVDYLIGAVDYILVPTKESIELGGKRFPISYSDSDLTFRSRFENLCLSKNITAENCEKELDFTPSQFIDVHYNRMPTLSELLKLSFAFNVSLDYLVGRTDQTTLQLSDDELDLIMNYRDCTPKYQENICKRAKDLSIESIGSSVAADKPLKKTGTDNLGK
ncbi:MAG: helix-turn-helix domain-containing protein [Lachnospiraceae bacterium]|nr:helix-turn-helix domain-containing protein [Lachnospiraceae bacterium]